MDLSLLVIAGPPIVAILVGRLLHGPLPASHRAPELVEPAPIIQRVVADRRRAEDAWDRAHAEAEAALATQQPSRAA